MNKTIINTPDAPAAIGPYAQGVTAEGRMIFVSGQLPVDPATGAIAGEDIATQTQQSLKNVLAVLAATGAGAEHVVKTTVFLQDMNEFSQMNAVYATFFTDAPPARAAVQVARLPKDARVEIEAIAVL